MRSNNNKLFLIKGRRPSIPRCVKCQYVANISISYMLNKTCHRDRIARLTAPSPSHKNCNVNLFVNADAAANTDANANADANSDAGGSTIALPGLRPGELKSHQRRWQSPPSPPLKAPPLIKCSISLFKKPGALQIRYS